jgi:CubicO group peptidase (beta-lactamase class C family)
MNHPVSASWLTPTSDPGAVGLCPERLSRLVAALQADVDCQRLPGAVAVVARRGQVALCAAVGQLDPARGTPMGTDALFRIYSMTKPVVSVAAMQLAEQGRLLLSDPVANYLPEFERLQVASTHGRKTVLRPVGRAPTVHDLLRHTAGFTYEFLGDSPVQRQYARANLASRERTNAEFTQALADLPLMYPPGSVWAYSRATDVLGRVVEVITGQPLGQHLQAAVLGPLGMVDTGFVVPPEQHHRIAEPFAHDPDGGTPMRVANPRLIPAMEGGGGGLMSSAHDYARFVQCLLNGGQLDGVRLLSPTTVAHMTSDHLGSLPAMGTLLPPGHGFGLGFAVRTAPGLAPTPGSVGMYFWSGIAGTSFFVDPALDLWAMLLIQAPNQRDHYRATFRHLVFAAVL